MQRRPPAATCSTSGLLDIWRLSTANISVVGKWAAAYNSVLMHPALKFFRKQAIRCLTLLVMLSAATTHLVRAQGAIFGSDRVAQNPLLIFKNGKWGYADSTGKIVIQPEFLGGEFFRNGLAKVWVTEDKANFVNATGDQKVIPNAASDAFCEGLMPVKVNGKYGFVNEALEIAIVPQFDYAGDFSEGLAPVEINRKYGYIDRTGKLVIQPQFDDAKEFSEGLAVVGFAKEVSDPLFHPFGENLYGYINNTGEIVIKPAYDHANGFSEGLAAVSIGSDIPIGSDVGSSRKCGYVDKAGRVVIELKFNAAQDFSEGLAAVKIGKKFGYIDKSERVVIPPQFEYAREFENGLAYATVGKTTYKFEHSVLHVIFHGKNGYINRAGKFLCPKLCWRS